MIDLIYDCDITMSLPGRDVDDGPALLYLPGSPQIRILQALLTLKRFTTFLMAGYWRTLFDGWRRAGEAWPQ